MVGLALVRLSLSFHYCKFVQCTCKVIWNLPYRICWTQSASSFGSILCWCVFQAVIEIRWRYYAHGTFFIIITWKSQKFRFLLSDSIIFDTWLITKPNATYTHVRLWIPRNLVKFSFRVKWFKPYLFTVIASVSLRQNSL